jgi:hypothetical protein
MNSFNPLTTQARRLGNVLTRTFFQLFDRFVFILKGVVG